MEIILAGFLPLFRAEQIDSFFPIGLLFSSFIFPS